MERASVQRAGWVRFPDSARSPRPPTIGAARTLCSVAPQPPSRPRGAPAVREALTAAAAAAADRRGGTLPGRRDHGLGRPFQPRRRRPLPRAAAAPGGRQGLADRTPERLQLEVHFLALPFP